MTRTKFNPCGRFTYISNIRGEGNVILEITIMTRSSPKGKGSGGERGKGKGIV